MKRSKWTPYYVCWVCWVIAWFVYMKARQAYPELNTVPTWPLGLAGNWFFWNLAKYIYANE